MRQSIVKVVWSLIGAMVRIERSIRTIREAVVKQWEGTLDEKIEKVIRVYNGPLHTAIKCTPMEAWKDQTSEVVIENDENGEYASKFKRRFREDFREGQIVRVARKEKVGINAKKKRKDGLLV
ncbi:hypothetical protein NGRA_1739 [Nosema granulosis]|uniref:Uncharacterized protein n=1 Tax=Nosema granulosis TaxID=83296 RepID=A0A9P6GXW0_9MICR|nr:hypothetical protein NGRA_1739 [Nosema granulosis]